MKDVKSNTIDCMVKYIDVIQRDKAVLQYVIDGRNEMLTLQIDDMSITMDAHEIKQLMR